MTHSKIFSASLSKNLQWRQALEEVTLKAKRELAGETCDFAVIFVSESYPKFDAEAFSLLLSDLLPYRVVMGCNSSGVVGNDTEVEMEPAISILAMHLPGVKLYPFHLSGEDITSFKSAAELINFLDIYPTKQPRFLCLADPATTDVAKFLQLFNESYKGLPLVGGLASGGVMGVPNWLCLNGTIHQDGMVGVAMVGDIEFETVVSQGCRPIGQPTVITKAQENVLYELGGRSALDVVHELLETISAKDRVLAEQSLSVGLVMNEQQVSFKRGDFLIRNLLGFDPQSGALMVGAHLKVGQTLQFQIRDAKISAEDLELMLQNLKETNGVSRGAMLVSCCGRGKDFYKEASHDARVIQSLAGPLPLAGFFASGEIGPVGQKNYVHGYTSSLVILR